MDKTFSGLQISSLVDIQPVSATTPALESPCIQGNCARKDKSKNSDACRYCKAREDFSLASENDKEALERYLKFDYKNLGQGVEKTTKNNFNCRLQSPADYYNEKYLRDAVFKIKRKFGKNFEFESLREVIIFLFQKYKMKTRVARFLGVSQGSVGHLWEAFGLSKNKDF
jgi:hypothetical protein